jgi:hypothetical protein
VNLRELEELSDLVKRRWEARQRGEVVLPIDWRPSGSSGGDLGLPTAFEEPQHNPCAKVRRPVFTGLRRTFGPEATAWLINPYIGDEAPLAVIAYTLGWREGDQ